MLKLGVLGSTRGSAMQAIIDAIAQQALPAQLAVVLSNRPEAIILQRAQNHHIPNQFINPDGLSREDYDQRLSAVLSQHQVDYVVLIGYMRILSAAFIADWRHKVINIHPSLLPAFANKMDKAVHEAVLNARVLETGCTVHEVTEEVDAGPILLQKKCPVLPDDTVESLKARVQSLEGSALIDTIQILAHQHRESCYA